ncbi:hypothetical protein VPT02_158 [Vibrio phage VPT02]|uniref:Uncharacterized protein n=1 Tax=Vibrio phage pVp-1 TaxID=1150989 RepID=H6WXN3_9CAUD|nr:hypothetical protein F404_gp142 [Vibrio phage pVp-1]AFB83999.1 hypothetical protein pVp-1_0142 [Vibrio phage pVp-1]QIG60734.1 hypothetical protein VPT02_158 [Vibrio phage VPT02]QQO38516.1 hypothetical protein VPG01_158 [Vibrio phage VPG01]
MTTKKVNFNTVYNDFGDTLPDKSTFFNASNNEVSRVMLRYRYKVDSDCRAFKLFQKEYAEFVASLKAAKTEPTKEKKDEVK